MTFPHFISLFTYFPCYFPYFPSLFAKNNSFFTEQKPNLRYRTTPQADFRKQNLSPNAAEGKERLGLKDLAKLVAENQENSAEKKADTAPASAKKGKTNNKNKRRNDRKGKKQSGKSHNNANTNITERDRAIPPVKPNINTSNNQIHSTHVKPEVEYQEKSVVDIKPSHNSLPLSTPVKHTEDFANKDNSVDGFLSIKH